MEDPSNLVISWTQKTDLNVTEMHDLHRYHFSRYLKGGIAIFEPFPIRERFPLLWEMDSISNYRKETNRSRRRGMVVNREKDSSGFLVPENILSIS